MESEATNEIERGIANAGLETVLARLDPEDVMVIQAALCVAFRDGRSANARAIAEVFA